MKTLILFLFTCSFIWSTSIQVIDQQSREPLPGVNIMVVGTDFGMNTDLQGYFTLDKKYQGRVINFSYIGYLDTSLHYQDILDASLIELTPDILKFSDIEVVSSKLEWEQADLPSLVTVLRTRELVNQGGVELKEALQRDPSVVVQESGRGVHEISIRGSNSDEVLIIYDGIPLNSSYLGGFDLSWINLNDIEGISIIKGAGTLKYGSGAFGGVVVLDPVKNRASGFSLNHQTSNQKLSAYSLSDMLRIGSFSTRLSYSSKEVLPYGFFNPDIKSQRNFLNVYSTYALQDTSNYFSLNFMDVAEALNPTDWLDSRLSDRYIQLKYTGGISFIKNLTLQALHRSNTEDESNLADPAYEIRNQTEESMDLLSIENKLIFKNAVNLFKVEIKQSEYTGLSNTRNVNWEHDDSHDIQLSQDWVALAEVVKYRTELGVSFVDFLELNASFRYDNIHLKRLHEAYWDNELYLEKKNSDDFDQLSRRNGFTLQKTRKQYRYQLFYTSGTNLRYPSLSDIYLRDHTTIGLYIDEPLHPELNASSEVGLQASIQPENKASIIETFDIQASVYKNKYTDKIYHTQIPRALPTPVNMTSTQLSGMELSTMASLLKDRLRLYLGTHRLNIASYTIFPNKPKFRDVVEVELNHHRANLRLQYFHEGKQYFGGSSDNINWVVTELPGRENLNIYASTSLNVDYKSYILGFTILNLLSEEDDPNYLNQLKWTLNVGVSL